MTRWTPPLQLDARDDRCHLTLEGVTYGTGETLQDAGNDLMARLHDLAVGIRRGNDHAAPTEFRADPRVYEFLCEIGELAATGGDLRARVFGGD